MPLAGRRPALIIAAALVLALLSSPDLYLLIREPVMIARASSFDFSSAQPRPATRDPRFLVCSDRAYTLRDQTLYVAASSHHVGWFHRGFVVIKIASVPGYFHKLSGACGDCALLEVLPRETLEQALVRQGYRHLGTADG